MTEEDDITGDGEGGGDRILAAEYVLGLLSATDRRAVEERLGGDAALRAEVATWAEHLAGLTEPFPEVAPPPGLWPRIEADLRTPVATRVRRRGLNFLSYALGGALAAALAWFVYSSGLMMPAAPEFKASIASEDNGLVFAAAYDADTSRLELHHQAGAAAAGRSLEFWLIADGDAPVSVMVWPAGSEQEVVTLPAELAAKLPGAVLAISDEPEGGSPTGQPTGSVLALGPVQAI